jgi:exportin-T
MAQTSQHIAQIPQAVSIAASPDPSISPQLRQEAIEYLNKVKVLSEETWQVRGRWRFGNKPREKS